jgi:hypothetical protein
LDATRCPTLCLPAAPTAGAQGVAQVSDTLSLKLKCCPCLPSIVCRPFLLFYKAFLLMRNNESKFGRLRLQMVRLILLSAQFLSASICYGQCLATFQDMTNQVMLFDGGEEQFLEPLPLLSQKIGRAGILAYIAPNGRFKVYEQGRTFTITDNTPNYYMTDNWFLYQNFNIIKVQYKNKLENPRNAV